MVHKTNNVFGPLGKLLDMKCNPLCSATWSINLRVTKKIKTKKDLQRINTFIYAKYDLRETHTLFVKVDPLIALYVTIMSIQTVLLVYV